MPHARALAVFDRAEARDFVDLYRLSTLCSNAQILALPGELDLGFDKGAFAQSTVWMQLRFRRPTVLTELFTAPR